VYIYKKKPNQFPKRYQQLAFEFFFIISKMNKCYIASTQKEVFGTGSELLIKPKTNYKEIKRRLT